MDDEEDEELSMGLFDKRDKGKKKKDEFDSPVEKVDLSANSAPAPVAKRAAPPPKRTEEKTSSTKTEKKPAPAPTPKPAAGQYGIDKAIELMRSLPGDNLELVVQTVKLALESTGVKIPAIIEDASKRQKQIQDKISELRGVVADLEKQIAARTKEIAKLEGEHQETTTVKERLSLAESLSARTKNTQATTPNKTTHQVPSTGNAEQHTVARIAQQKATSTPVSPNPANASPANVVAKK